MNTSGNNDIPYIKKVWIKGSVYALIVVLLLFLKATFSVLLLILAGALIAIFFRGLSGLIQRKTKWNSNVCLIISIVGTIVIAAAIFWLIGAKLQSQFAELSNKIPEMASNAKEKLSESDIGKKIVGKLSSQDSMKKGQALLGTFFKSTFGIFGDIYVVIFLGIFFTASPAIYKKGMVKLIPPTGKHKAEEVLQKLSVNLQKWLKGKIFSMIVVMALTAIGLSVIGMPLWLVLAIIAGVLNFIPNFGPLIAMVPAVLVALIQGPTTALIVAIMYILIQVLESNFITPMVQQRLVSIPPALIIIAQLLVAPFTGVWGLVLATPLMLILMTLVNELYVKRIAAK